MIDNSNPDLLTYVLKVWGGAVDGLDFVPAVDACLTTTVPNVPLYLGQNRIEVTNHPLNLTTLETCTAPPTPAECGEPIYDRATEPGLYLWKDCDTVGTDAVWHMRVAGGGLGWAPYAGLLTATNPVTATGVMLEANDTLDGTSGDNGLDFTLNVANAGVDGIDLQFPATSQTCLDLQSMPAGAQLYIGRDRSLRTGTFNLEDLGLCQ
ncbi:MAG: hypothetical protein KZQ78_09055 [Candidatus Thiodiazotropha sp. (ex Ustalcina ferruginea)]|nr:hypothetical protein [Candidatus Thiodiazotropha sp. (ex Ustalcina ferruginea)]